LILLVMLTCSIVLAGAAVLYIIRYQNLAEARLAEQAAEEFKKEDYAAAARSYEKLTNEYPSSEDIGKYRFFADLAGMQVLVRGVTNREDYQAALNRLKAFITAQKDSPFAKPTSGYGRDVHEAGKKLAEDIVAHANDRVQAFRKDRSKFDELTRADQAIADGRALMPLLEPFRPSDDPPLDALRAGLDEVEASVKWERDRTAALTRARAQLLERLSDARIQVVEAELGPFLSDPEAQELIAEAKGKLRDLVRYESDPANPQVPPASAAATILFVSPVGPTRPRSASTVGEDLRPAVFLAVARGVLYALDEEKGLLLWAVRVGPDTTDPPTVARVDLPEGPTEIALVTSNVDGQAALAAYVLHSGEAKWYQPLQVADPDDPRRMHSAPAAGPAVVLGNRAYVPVRDEQGTIYEFDLTRGTREGRIRLGQPIGPGAIVRPGTGLLYVPAEARRVYVIDAGVKDEDGNPLPPRCVQVIATNHPAGTLRTPPLLLGPDSDTPGDVWMLLLQADGPSSMKLRAFTLQPILPPSPDGKLPPETPVDAAIEHPLPGWAWFPPIVDGERVAVVTDTGQFRLFGVNQPGSFDKPLFPVPTPSLPTPRDGTAVPGLVLPAEESTFWLLANAELQKYRLLLVPSRGWELIPVGIPVPIGVPIQPPQFTSNRDAACLVVRSQNSAGCKAVLVNLRDGELRWQRQLGVVPVTAPLPQGQGLLLIAEDGGLVRIPLVTGALPGQNTPAPADWVIAPAPVNVTSPTAVAVSMDGKTVFTVTPVLVRENNKDVAKFVIRRVVEGVVTHDGIVAAPAPLAGPPIVLGDSLLLAAADGFIYRHIPGTGRLNPDSLVAGPPWTSDRRGSQAFLTPVSESMFLTNDGGKKMSRWEWAFSGRWNPGGTWELREPPASPGLTLPPVDGARRLLIADVTGSVWLFPNERGGQPLRRWRPGAGIPIGKPTSPFVAQSDARGRLVVAYTVDDKYVVSLDPNKEVSLWSAPIGEETEAILVGAPQPAGDGRWLATDLTGRVLVFDGTNPKPTATLGVGLPGAVAAAAGGSLGGTAVLTPLSDGSAVLLALPEPSAVAPPPIVKE
jgi:outer membrane protein assembly factor BamB